MSSHLKKIPWDKSIFFFDIDDTLISTLETTFIASEGIESVFSEVFDVQTGEKIKNNFNKIFQTLAVGHFKSHEFTSEENIFYEDVLRVISESQQQGIQQFGHAKKWSREVFIWYASQLAGHSVSSELIKKAADAYWMIMSNKITVLPGVSELFSAIHMHTRPVYLLTGSDARLQMISDGQFVYDPVYSETLKRKRIELLREKGIIFNSVSIGDPEDKPHIDFFKKGIDVARKEIGDQFNPSNAILAGDSYAADLEVPKVSFGFGLVVLVKKEQPKLNYVDEHYIQTGNIADILKFLQ